MDVLRLDASDPTHVRLFSSIRLRALQNDPAAFGSTYEREQSFDDDVWRERLAGFAGHPGAVFIVASDASGVAPSGAAITPVGVVGVGLPEPADAVIWGMWVAPEGRRQGLAAHLLDAAQRWAGEAGAHTVTLWVHRSNDPARALYLNCGYEPVGPDDVPTHVHDSCSDEICLRVRLDPVPYAARP